METKTASSRTEGLLALFDIQTTYFERALEGVSEEDRHNRLGTPANHMAWLAGALVAQRYQMASEIDHGLKQAGAELFDGYKGIQDVASYPTLVEYVKDWKEISPHARQALTELDDAKLDSDFHMDEMTMTWYELISFTIYREASMIGQLALWRRLLGYPGMRYD